MNRTRLSLVYLASYLGLGGAGLLLAPQLSLDLLGAKRSYDPVFIQFSGMFMLAMSGVVITFIQHRLEALYKNTIIIRGFFLVCLIWFYRETRDPLFLVILGVVGLGVLFTGISLALDRRAQS
jgi:hypothetical protein